MNPLDDLKAVLASLPGGHAESVLQTRLEARLKAWGIRHGLKWERETRLDPHNRIDFTAELPAGRVGIECKTVWKGREVERQIYRYADHLAEIILVSSKPLAIASGTIKNARNEPVTLTVLELGKNQI